MGPLTIGWASRDITPACPVAIRGQFNLRIATRIQDPLSLTALAIESDGEQVIFVSLDGAGADTALLEASRPLLAKRLPGFDPRKLIVGATHTHTAPFASGGVGLQSDADYMDELLARYPGYTSVAEYAAFLAETLADAAAEAWANRQPGQIGFGYTYAVVGENRRVRYFDDRAVMYGKVSEPDFSHIEGHVDHGVHLLCTYDPSGQLTGMVINIPCPSQASEGGQDYVSADYWHDVREEIRRRQGAGLGPAEARPLHGPGPAQARPLHILPQCAAAGDQTPHRQIDRRAEERMMKLKFGEGLNNGWNMALRQDLARRVADAVQDAEPVVRQDLRDTAVLKHEPRHLDVPHWDVTDDEYAALQSEMAELKQRLEQLGEGDRLSSQYTATRSRLAWCQRAVDRYENPLPSVPVEMNVVRLGDIAFVTAPFEYYLDFGDRIKARSAAVQTFIIQLTGTGGYLPTERAAAGKSYGAVPPSCRVAPRGGQVIVDEAVRVIGEMFAEEM